MAVQQNTVARFDSTVTERRAAREPARLVNAGEGAELLGIAPSRFARLARCGLLSPVDFHLSRHRVIVWRYAAAELGLFARRHLELLGGPVPEELREMLRRGEDRRPRSWRSRRTGRLAERAEGPWQRAAVQAAVLEPPVLAADVPDPGERAVLCRLRPRLTGTRLATSHHRDLVGPLLTARDPEESRRYRAALSRALAEARAGAPPSGG